MKLKGKASATLILLLVFLAGAGSAVLIYCFTPLYNSINAALSAEVLKGVDTGKNSPYDSDLLEAAFQAAAAFKNKDYAALSELVHPEKGVLFVPYSTVQKDKNLSFSADEVKTFDSDSKKRIWGVMHGSGDPIDLAPLAYIEKFVYDQDYLNAPVIGRNRVIGTGNAIENVKDAFPDAEFIEFHFPGFDTQYGGLDWKSLKLVFEKYKGSYKLIAVIHSEWTV